MRLFLLFCFVVVVPTVCDASFSVKKRITADKMTIIVTLYSSYPKCMIKLLKHNETESNTIVNEQTPIPKPGYRSAKQCVFKFTNLTPGSIYVTRLYLVVKAHWTSKLVWSIPRVTIYRTKPKEVKPVRPVRPVLPEVSKPVEEKETATVTVLQREASRDDGPYEIRAETTRKLVNLTVVPKGVKFESGQIVECQIILGYTQNREGPGVFRTAPYKGNKCVFSLTYLPGKEISILVQLRRNFTCKVDYSIWRWLSWCPRYSGLKTKEFAVRAVTQKTKPTVLQREASRDDGPSYEIRAETTRKLVKLTVVPKGVAFFLKSLYCEFLVRETQSRRGLRVLTKAPYNRNKCVLSLTYLPKGKEFSIYVRMRYCRPGQVTYFDYSEWRWLTWSPRYSGLKTKEAVVRVVTQKTKPKDFSGGFALEQNPYGDHVRVIVTLPPNSKDEQCDLYAQRRIQTKLVEKGQCEFQVRSKFPNNVRIRARVKQSIPVDGKFYQAKTDWKSVELISWKLLKLKPGSSKLKDLYHVLAHDLEETVKLAVRPNRDLSIYKSLSHCEIELRSRGHPTWKLKQPYVNKECGFYVKGLNKNTAFDIRVRMLGGSRNKAPQNWYFWSSQYTGLKTLPGIFYWRLRILGV